MTKIVKTIWLGKTEGSEDKQYFVNLSQTNGLYAVFGANCRRGATPKNQNPVIENAALPDAEKAFDKLVASKLKTGYNIEKGEAAYDALPVNKVASGIRLQMLTPIDETFVEDLLENPTFGLMEKIDGERRALQAADEPIALNKQGFRVSMAGWLNDIVAKLPTGTIIDGEIVGDVYYAFDLLAHGTTDVRSRGFEDRYDLLLQVIQDTGITSSAFRIVELVKDAAKRAAYNALHDTKKEGAVFKDLRAPYEAGRDTSGKTAVKYKFYTTCTIEITGKTPGKNSLSMQMYRKGVPVAVGNVTIAASMSVPPVGSFAEIRYLYVNGEDGALYQPTFLHLRSDVDASDCDVSQLKRKPVAS